VYYEPSSPCIFKHTATNLLSHVLGAGGLDAFAPESITINPFLPRLLLGFP